MKEKNVAGVLALFLGGFGVHRFYLGQTGLGIFYLIFCWFPVMWIIGLIDAIVFFSMTREDFDYKYNRRYVEADRIDDDRYETHRDHRRERREYRHERREYRRERSSRPTPRPPERKATPSPRANPYKSSGIKKYKDYDYDGAIADFEKALEIEPNDVAVHFNLACAQSLNENTDQAFYHLDRAVALGFDDFQRIKEHDALAFLRIQDKFEEFERNGFRLVQQLEAPKSDLLDTAAGTSSDLLEQLQKLGELREKGLLTEEEFVAQKKKLLNE